MYVISNHASIHTLLMIVAPKQPLTFFSANERLILKEQQQKKEVSPPPPVRVVSHDKSVTCDLLPKEASLHNKCQDAAKKQDLVISELRRSVEKGSKERDNLFIQQVLLPNPIKDDAPSNSYPLPFHEFFISNNHEVLFSNNLGWSPTTGPHTSGSFLFSPLIYLISQLLLSTETGE